MNRVLSCLLAKGLQHKTQEMTESDIAKAVAIDKDKLKRLLLAETYHYTTGIVDLDILKRSHNALMRVLLEPSLEDS